MRSRYSVIYGPIANGSDIILIQFMKVTAINCNRANLIAVHICNKLRSVTSFPSVKQLIGIGLSFSIRSTVSNDYTVAFCNCWAHC